MLNDPEKLIELVGAGDVIGKLLAAFAIYTIKQFGGKLDKVANNVADLNRQIAIIFEKHEQKDEQIKNNLKAINRNSEDILKMRDRLHDIVNNYAMKTERNEIMIEEIKARVFGNGH